MEKGAIDGLNRISNRLRSFLRLGRLLWDILV